VDLTVGRPIRIFALVAVVAAVGGLAMLTLKPKHSVTPPAAASKPARPTTVRTPATPARRTHAAAKPVTKPVGAATKASTKPAIRAARKPVAKAVPAVGANGLPSTIDAAFRKHAIVVVSVFDPQSSTDAISYSEAKAGAADARVGFVGISLLDSPVAAALTSSLPGGGLLPAPGVLVYRRPGTLVQRIDGFADRDVVAQAAASGATAPPVTGPPVTGP